MHGIFAMLTLATTTIHAQTNYVSSGGANLQTAIDNAPVTTLLLTVLQTVILFVGVVVAVISLRSDHKRRKQQGFFEYYHQKTMSTSSLQKNIETQYGDKPIAPTSEDFQKIQADVDTWFWMMESLAVAINLNVFDLECYMKCEGRAVVALFEKLKPILLEKRKDRPYRCYSDVEEMVNKINEKYSKRDAGNKFGILNRLGFKTCF